MYSNSLGVPISIGIPKYHSTTTPENDIANSFHQWPVWLAEYITEHNTLKNVVMQERGGGAYQSSIMWPFPMTACWFGCPSVIFNLLGIMPLLPFWRSSRVLVIIAMRASVISTRWLQMPWARSVLTCRSNIRVLASSIPSIWLTIINWPRSWPWVSPLPNHSCHKILTWSPV